MSEKDKKKKVKQVNYERLLDSKEVVSRDQATKELYDWMRDWRRIKSRMVDTKVPETKSSIENTIENIVDGTLSINPETGQVTHKLTFKIGEDIEGNENVISELIFNPRLKGDAFDGVRKFQNPDEQTKNMAAISKLTNKQFGMIKKMEQCDLMNAQDLLFFYFL